MSKYFQTVAEKYAQADVVAYWQQFNNWGLQAAESFLIERHLAKDSVVLDLGCGTGRAGFALQRQGFKTIGLDLSFSLLEAGGLFFKRKKMPAFFTHGNMTTLPFPDNHFDNIICLYASIQHLPTIQLRQQCFAEIARVMKPNGKLIIGIDNLAPALSIYFYWVWRKAMTMLGQSKPQPIMNTASLTPPIHPSPSQPAPAYTIADHLKGVGRSIRWQTGQIWRDMRYRFGLAKGEKGDVQIDRVASVSTKGNIWYHVYHDNGLLNEIHPFGFACLEHISEREVRQNQHYPNYARGWEHQLIYAFELES
jgi:ubiquinone/menaquinone biosynthesis C-methylase UbiE